MNLQNFCKSVSFLSKSRKITFYEHQVNVVCDFKSFSQLKEKRIRRGGHKKVHSLLKEKREFWENIKSFHSAKFRFTFTHVYIHAPLNLKIKPIVV